ncbi:hypothetical protein TU81_13695 [Pseudomonas lini]|nr:hypothetical protein TU81_13695 [Pseudomonas lini]
MHPAKNGLRLAGVGGDIGVSEGFDFQRFADEGVDPLQIRLGGDADPHCAIKRPALSLMCDEGFHGTAMSIYAAR